jgi:hypothetical protein
VSRTTQFIGLSANAQDFLYKNSSQVRRITMQENTKGQMEITQDIMVSVLPEHEIYAHAAGMFEGDEIPLYKYFIDGHWWFERVQFQEWSSGPVIATRLKADDGRVWEWTYEDYKIYL